MPVSTVPVIVKSPKNFARFPSMKIHVMTPSVALKESTLSRIALMGKMIEPVNAKSRIKTLRKTQPNAQGSALAIPFWVSV